MSKQNEVNEGNRKGMRVGLGYEAGGGEEHECDNKRALA